MTSEQQTRKRGRWRVDRWNQPGSGVHGLYFCRDRRTSLFGDGATTCRQTHLTRQLAEQHAEAMNAVERGGPTPGQGDGPPAVSQ